MRGKKLNYQQAVAGARKRVVLARLLIREGAGFLLIWLKLFLVHCVWNCLDILASLGSLRVMDMVLVQICAKVLG